MLVEIENALVIENIKRRASQKSILAEHVEGLVPLAYAIGLAMAYFGPNVYLLGNVFRDIWAYEKVKDVKYLLFIMSLAIHP